MSSKSLNKVGAKIKKIIIKKVEKNGGKKNGVKKKLGKKNKKVEKKSGGETSLRSHARLLNNFRKLPLSSCLA